MYTVAHLIDSYNRDALTRVKTRQCSPKTREFYAFQDRKLRSAAGHLPAAELRPHHLHAVEFSNHFVRALKHLYRWGVDADLVPVDPFRKLVAPPTGQRQRVLTDAEVVRLYRGASEHFREYLFLALHTIMRPKELRELTWGQVDLARRVVTLNKFKAMDRRRDKLRVRVVPLDRAVTRRLARLHLARRPKLTDPVVVTKSGRAWDYTSQRVAMRRARDRAGLEADGFGEKVVCYSLRHTGATEAARDGVRDTELADLMGHTSIAMTRRYLHRTAADLVGIIDRRRRPAGTRPG